MCRAATAEYHWQLSPSRSLCLACHLLLSRALLTKTCPWHRQRVEVEVVVVFVVSPLLSYTVCPPSSLPFAFSQSLSLHYSPSLCLSFPVCFYVISQISFVFRNVLRRAILCNVISLRRSDSAHNGHADMRTRLCTGEHAVRIYL